MQQRSILFIYINYSSFVKTDYEILSSFAKVDKYQFNPGRGVIHTSLELVRQFFYLLLKIRRYDVVYIWFADIHALFPVAFARLTGKISYIVIGGYDVLRVRSLSYGLFCSQFRGFFALTAMKKCTVNLTVSENIDRKVKYISPKSNRQLIPNCVNIEDLSDDETLKENTVLSVAIIENERTFKIKGIDTYIEVARLLPKFNFVLVGIDRVAVQYLLKDLPSNLKLIPKVAHNELAHYYKQAKIYCQLSRYESFGVSIAEAMLHDCIPIVTNEGGMPEIVGDTGYIVQRDPVKISKLINEILTGHSTYKNRASNRITTYFSKERRESLLVNLIQ
jgi:glycosyltransferase involved in cell wall biosynthesis